MCLFLPLLLFLAPAFPLLLYFLMTCRPWACVLAHLGCINKIPWRVACEHRCLFLTVLEAEVQDQGTGTFGVQCELSSWFMGLLSMSSHGRGTRVISKVSLMRALIPLVRAPPPWPHHLPHLQTPTNWGFTLPYKPRETQAFSLWKYISPYYLSQIYSI